MATNLITKIKKARKPVIILISGVPATGKSTLAIHLANKLNFKVSLGVDELKEVIKIYDKNPYLQRSSHDGWELIGTRNKKNILLGFNRYCQGFQRAVEAIIKRSESNGENAIIEGVHLLPKLYRGYSDANLFHFVVKSNFDKRRKGKIRNKIAERHQKQTDVWSRRDIEIRLIQELVLSQAKKHDCAIIAEDSTKKMVSQIIKLLEADEIE